MGANTGDFRLGRRRTRDLSCTVFINDPADYDGGALHVQLGNADLRFKEAPGGADWRTGSPSRSIPSHARSASEAAT